MEKFFSGTGRRKNAIAQVRISSGLGKRKVVGESKRSTDMITDDVMQPLKLIGEEKNFDIRVVLKGGGVVAQKDAILLGLARAIIKAKPETEKVLKKEGFLTRDPREKERKKPGLKRARKAPQWAKR